MDTRSSNEHDVFTLLTRLKESSGAYPRELLTLRRLKYVRRAHEMSVDLGVAPSLRRTPKQGKGGGSSKPGSFIETALIVALIAEGSIAAYLYRDELARIVRAEATDIQVNVSAELRGFVSPTFELVSTKSPTPRATSTRTATATPTPTLTATATMEASTNTPAAEQNSSNVTPNPNGNNGNHYGQTPKPERTKDKGGDDEEEEKDKDKGNRPNP